MYSDGTSSNRFMNRLNKAAVKTAVRLAATTARSSGAVLALWRAEELSVDVVVMGGPG